MSAFTRNSSTSFLLLLVAWISLVLIVPRASIMTAGQLVAVPSQAEIEGRRDAFAKQAWGNYENELSERWRSRNAEMEGMSPSEREAYRDANLWQWMEEDDTKRQNMEKEIHDFALRQQQDVRNSKAEQERLAFTLSRFSPASAFQLIAMNLAGSNIDLKTRYEDALQHYRDAFISYKDKKAQKTGDRGGLRVMMDSESGFNVSVGRSKGTLDLTDMPQFLDPQYRFENTLATVVLDMGIIAMVSLLAFAGAFVSFLRYDVR